MLSFVLLVLLLAQSPKAFSQDSEGDPNLAQDDSGNLPAHNQEATEPVQQTQRRNTMGTNDNFEGGPVTRDTLRSNCERDGGRVAGVEGGDGIRCSFNGSDFNYTKYGKTAIDDDAETLAMEKRLNKKRDSKENLDATVDDSRSSGMRSSSQQPSLNSTTTQSTSSSNDDDTAPSSTSSSSNNSYTRAPSGDDLQKGLNDCAQATLNAESTCDEYSNKDLSSFHSGASRLVGMMAGSGGAAGNCALNGALAALVPGVTAAVTSQCAAAYYSCSSACSQATAASASQPAFVTAIASYKSRCESLSKKTNSFTSSVQGVGNSVKAAYECQKQLANNNDCMKDPIKCIFGNSDCSTPQSRQNNPACFCQYTNPNDPMCAIVNKMQDPNSTSDLASTTSLSSKLSADTPAALPLSRQSSSADEPPNPAEALLANSKPQPLGTVELQGKSGDGLSGTSGGGSTLGSAQKLGSAGQARSNIDTKINSGFLSAASFGIPPVAGTGPPVSQSKRFQMYKSAVRQKYPRMKKLDALALAHTLALRDVNHWLRLQDAVDQGQTEEQLTPLKAVLAAEPIFMDEKKMVTAADFIAKKQDNVEKEKSFYDSFIEFIGECYFYMGHKENHPLMALLSFILLAGISLIGAILPMALFERFYLKNPIIRRRKKNRETFSQYIPDLNEQDQKQLLEIDFEKIGGFSILYTYHYLWNLKNDLQYLNQALQKNGLTVEHKFMNFDKKVLLSCLYTEGQKDPEATGFVPMFLEKNERRLNYALAHYGLEDEMQWKYQKPISAEALLKTYGDKRKQIKRAG